MVRYRRIGRHSRGVCFLTEFDGCRQIEKPSPNLKSVHDSFLCRLIFFLGIYIELSLHYLEFNNHEL